MKWPGTESGFGVDRPPGSTIEEQKDADLAASVSEYEAAQEAAQEAAALKELQQAIAADPEAYGYSIVTEAGHPRHPWYMNPLMWAGGAALAALAWWRLRP